MAALSHRHQSSLEGIIGLSEAAPIFENEEQRDQAIDRFRRIVAHFGNTEQQPASSRSYNGYNRPALVRLIFEYARSLESQDACGPPRAKPLSPTPTYHIEVQQVQTQEEQQRMQEFVGTPERMGALRGLCLTRDRHRCVITRAFNKDELAQRLRQSPQSPARDDDGNVLNPRDGYSHLEVAHILPFGLTKAEEGGELSESKKATIAILNMFDIGIFFERVADDDTADTYQIQTFHPFLSAQLQFPICRTFFSHASIDPPLERLLELHSAIGHVLHMSGAGEYINTILRNLEDGVVQEDGSTQLGALVNAALQIST
ncbi:hypothetical protein B0T22DRAFT_527268 [Podospora appendiculata]|uniref:HNH nuclease domain-containing protein n=1 Tax=Podospora appendiculata TaxID=314037 RepID=A0AAE0X7C7_9PEZI|nr:hypothetical protein B0T22DRAFT_527268 [Podospora appendiculata]